MPRPLALFALLLVSLAVAAPSVADTTTVGTLETSFSPASVTVQLGDTVKWVWSSSIHTVTSGFDSDDLAMGMLFDAPLTEANPVFTYTFSDTAGTYPYFCQPHEAMGMFGTVVVEIVAGIPGPEAASKTTWGRVKALFN
jgi:plastocyanin